jgi:hypothetical protein
MPLVPLVLLVSLIPLVPLVLSVFHRLRTTRVDQKGYIGFYSKTFKMIVFVQDQKSSVYNILMMFVVSLLYKFPLN